MTGPKCAWAGYSTVARECGVAPCRTRRAAVGMCACVTALQPRCRTTRVLGCRGKRPARCLAAGAGLQVAVLMQCSEVHCLLQGPQMAAADLGIVFVVPQDDLWSHVDWRPHSRLGWAVHLMLQQAGVSAAGMDRVRKGRAQHQQPPLCMRHQAWQKRSRGTAWRSTCVRSMMGAKARPDHGRCSAALGSARTMFAAAQVGTLLTPPVTESLQTKCLPEERQDKNVHAERCITTWQAFTPHQQRVLAGQRAQCCHLQPTQHRTTCRSPT